MFTQILAFLANTAGVIKSLFDRITQKEAYLNSKEIVDNITAQKKTAATTDNENTVAKAINTGDLDEIRKRTGF